MKQKYVEKVKTNLSQTSNKGRRKLEFSKQLPLSGKIIYLDVKDIRQTRTLEGKIQQLGGLVEKFLIKEVNYVISSNAPTTKPRRSEKGAGTADSPVQQSTPSPFNLGQSPSPGPPENKKETVTRGKAMLQIARHKGTHTNVIDTALKMNIKIVALDAAVKWIDKEMMKIKPTVSSTSSKHTHKKKPGMKVQRLKTPFVKFEANNCHYRPIMSQLETWPRCNVETLAGTCPFDGRALGRPQNSERGDREEGGVGGVNILSPATPQAQRDELSGTPQPTKSQSKTTKVEENSNCKLFGVPIVTAGEIKREKDRRKREAKRKGYCECCKEKYDDVDKHLRGEQHKNFVRNKKNFDALDRLINKGPNTVRFLQKILLTHCVQKAARKPNSQQDCEEDVELIEDIKPSPELAPEQLRVGRKVSRKHKGYKHDQPGRLSIQFEQTAFRENCEQAYSSPSKQRSNSVPSGVESSSTSAVVIRRSGSRGVYGSPRRPNSNNVTSEKTLVIRDSPIASLQPLREFLNKHSSRASSSCSITNNNGVLDKGIRKRKSNSSQESPDQKRKHRRSNSLCVEADMHTDSKIDSDNKLASTCIIRLLNEPDSGPSVQSADLASLSQSPSRKSRTNIKLCDDNLSPRKSKRLCTTGTQLIDQEEDLSLKLKSEESETTQSESSNTKDKKQDTKDKTQDTKDKMKDTKDKTQDTKDKKQDTKDKKQDTKDKKQISIDKKQISIDNMQDKNDRKQDTKDKRKDTKDKKQETKDNNQDTKDDAGDHIKTPCNTAEAEQLSKRKHRSRSRHRKSDETASQCSEKNISQTKFEIADKLFNSGSQLSPLKRSTNLDSQASVEVVGTVDEESNSKPKKEKRKKWKISHASRPKNVKGRKLEKLKLDESLCSDLSLPSLTPQKPSPVSQINLSDSSSPTFKKKKPKVVTDKADLAAAMPVLDSALSPIFKRKSRRDRSQEKTPTQSKIKEETSDVDTPKSGYSLTPRRPLRSQRNIELEYETESPDILDKTLCENDFESKLQDMPTDVDKQVDMSPTRSTKHRLDSHNDDHIVPRRSRSRSAGRKDRRKLLANEQSANTDKNHSPSESKTVSSNAKMHRSPSKSKTVNTNTHRSPSKSRSVTTNIHCSPSKSRNVTANTHCSPSKSRSVTTNIHCSPSKSRSVTTNIHCSPSKSRNVTANIHRSPSKSRNVTANIHHFPSKSRQDESIAEVRRSPRKAPKVELKPGEENAQSKKTKKRWRRCNSDTKPSKKVKLNRSWLILSERSLSKLLESEDDQEPFLGFNKEQSDANLPSDLTYEEVSEVDMSEDSMREWIIDESEDEVETLDKTLMAETSLVTHYFPSPDKASNSSWGDACDSFLKSACEKRLKADVCSTPLLLGKERSPSRKRKVKDSRKGEPCAGLNVPVEVGSHSTPRKNKASKSEPMKNSGRKTRFSPIKFDDNEVMVDKDIVFNFNSSPKRGKSSNSGTRKLFNQSPDKPTSDKGLRLLKKASDIKKSFKMSYGNRSNQAKSPKPKRRVEIEAGKTVIIVSPRSKQK